MKFYIKILACVNYNILIAICLLPTNILISFDFVKNICFSVMKRNISHKVVVLVFLHLSDNK